VLFLFDKDFINNKLKKVHNRTLKGNVMSTSKPNLLVFASGTATGGGSGFENLVQSSQIISANIVGVVSNHASGGVWAKAQKLGIEFEHFPGPFTAEYYQTIVRQFRGDYVALSGWLKLVAGLDSRTTFNIHPGPLPQFGGRGMYGHHVHEAVLRAFHAGQIQESAVSMHFVTEEYDMGPVFFVHRVPICLHDTAEMLGSRVNRFEHIYQPIITDLVVTGKIHWDGRNKQSLQVPTDYSYLPK
jgi:folate-dependent phosphoribosylglycinamide formyltransferase PurN